MKVTIKVGLIFMSNPIISSLSEVIIKKQKVKNRLCFSAMGLDMALGNGAISPEMAKFYHDIANGGVGILILPNASVASTSKLNANGLGMYSEAHSLALASFLKGIKKEGLLVGIQLQHYGGQGKSIEGEPLLTPSGVPCKLRQSKEQTYKTKEMSFDDIKLVIDQFVSSAVLAYQAGAEYIQLQASNGYLLSSFLSPYTNLRKDDYGGTPLKRARILVEIVKRIRQETSDSLIIGVRIGLDDMVGDAGQKVEYLKEVAPALEVAGVDVFEASMCVGETFHNFLHPNPEFLEENKQKLKLFKSYCTVPLIYSGFIDSIKCADDLISSNILDIAGMTRALFADNNLINKTQTGRVDQIDKCLWDGNCFKDKSNKQLDRVYCCVNSKYKRPHHIQY